MKELLLDLQYILRPSFWLQNRPTCKIWDKKLNDLMDNAKEVKVRDHTCHIDGVGVWISNHPYASGSLYPSGYFLPKKRTREKLLRFVEKSLYDKKCSKEVKLIHEGFRVKK